MDKMKNLNKGFRAVLGLVLMLCLLVGLFPAAVSAADGDTWDPDNGSYVISTAADLNAFRSSITGTTTYEGITITLANDIDVAGTEWTALDTSGNFYGILDGQGFTISGFDDNSFGLLYNIYGQLENLNVSFDVEEIAVNYGGLAYNLCSGSIVSECSVSGSLQGSAVIAGLAEQVTNRVAITIENCYSSVNITSSSGACGVVTTALPGTTIQNCYTTGALSGSYVYPISNVIIGSTVTGCYYIDTIVPKAAVTGVTAKTAEELKTQATYDGWDFDTIWQIEADGYPSLRQSTVEVAVMAKIAALPKAESLTLDDETAVKEARAAYEALTDTQKALVSEESLAVLKAAEDAIVVLKADNTFYPEAESYVISTVYDLNVFRSSISSTNTYEGITVTLANDIDVTGTEWTALDTAVGAIFAGTLDGQGFTISGVNDNQHGLFIYVSGQIKNLNVSFNVEGITSYYGGLAYELLDGAVVSGCSVSGSLQESSSVYTISGMVNKVEKDGTVTVENCYSTVDITAKTVMGILMEGTSGTVIQNCYTTGELNGTYVYPITSTNYGATITDCYYLDTIDVYDYNVAGTAKTADELKTQSTYENWDFNSIWQINAAFNDGYPTLLQGGTVYSDQEVADAVKAMIAQLPADISLDDRNKIENVRSVFDSLTDAQKSLVDNLGVLEAAEAAIDTLKGDSTFDPSAGSYVISTAYDLKLFRSSISDRNTYQGLTVTLGRNIEIESGQTQWSVVDSEGVFNGVLDGKGYTISGFDDNACGLIYELGELGKIVNLNIEFNVKDAPARYGGFVNYTVNGKIESCSSRGSITGQQQIAPIAYSVSASGLIENCYNSASILTYTPEGSTSKNIHIGGLVYAASSGDIVNCYTIGDMTNSQTNSGAAIYAIGRGPSDNSAGIGSTCYYLDTIETAAGDLFEARNIGTAKTADQLKSQDTYTDWDFDTIWQIDASVNDGYPTLRQTSEVVGKQTVELKAIITVADKQVTDETIEELIASKDTFLLPDFTIKLVPVDATNVDETIIDTYHVSLEKKDDYGKTGNVNVFPGQEVDNMVLDDSKINSMINTKQMDFSYDANDLYAFEVFTDVGFLLSYEANTPSFTFNGDTTPPTDEEKAAILDATKASIKSQIAEYIPEGGLPAETDSGSLDSWLIFTAARAGYDFDMAGCYQRYVALYQSGKGTYNAKDVLAITAMGYDARNVGGYNLIEKINGGGSWFGGQVINFAMNSYNYGEDGWDTEYIHGLAAGVLNGSSGENGEGDQSAGIDMYVMQFQPIAAYYDPDAVEGDEFYDVKQAMETVIFPYLSGMQGYTGTFYSGVVYGNPWSTAQADITLGMSGVNIFDTMFIKNGFTLLSDLNGSTGFSSDVAQCARGYEAMVRAAEGRNQIFDCTDVLNSTIPVNNALAELPDADAITSFTKADAQAKLAAVDTLLNTLTLTDGQTATLDMTAYNAVKTKLESGEIPDVDAATQAVIDAISALPAADAITLDNEAVVTAARSAYTALTDDQKKLVNADLVSKLEAAETAIDNLKPDSGTVTFDVERFTIGQGFFTEPVTMAYTKGDTVMTLLEQAVGADNLVFESGYMTAIKGTDAGSDSLAIPDYIVTLGGGDTEAATSYGNSLADSALGSYSYSAEAGWMYLVNNESATVGMSDYQVNDGDVIRIAFTYYGYGADLTGYVWGETEAKVVIGNRDALLKALAAVNSADNRDTLLENTDVKSAYDNALAIVADMTKTTDQTQAAADALNQAVAAADGVSEADQAAADAVKAKITALPAANKLALVDKSTVTAARAAYTALTADQQKLVTNLSTLTAAEAKIAELEQAVIDQEKADAVTALISGLPATTAMTLSDQAEVVAARSAYTALTATQKNLVTNLATLTAAETRIAELIAAESMTITIDVERFTIGQGFYVEPVTLSITEGMTAREAVEELLGADNLVGEVGYLRAVVGADTGSVVIPDYIVSTLGGGDTATAMAYGQKYTGSTLGEFDYSNDSGWIYLVNNETPNVGMNAYTLEDGDVLRLAFTYCGYGEDLTGLEYGTNSLLVSIANKDNLLKQIAVVNGNKTAYLEDETVAEAYNTAMTVVSNMTATQKATNDAVSDLAEAIAAFVPDDDDQTLADAVTAKIAALPAVDDLTLIDKSTVTAARAAYDSLTETQKALVTNLSTLVAAEAKIKQLEDETPVAIDEATGIEMIGFEEGIGLVVGDLSDNEDVEAAALAAAEKKGLTGAAIISLYNIKPDLTADELEAFNEDSDAKAILTIPIPEDKQGYDAYMIYHLKESGAVEWITPVLSDDGKSLIFTVSEFSTFAIVVEDEKQDEDNADVPTISYQTHIQNVGWQRDKTNGELSGTEGRSLRLEGIKIDVSSDEDVGVAYQTQIENIGWQETKYDGDLSGTEGQGLRLEGIRIWLTGDDADQYDVYYRVHAQNFGWLDWAKDGENAGTEGFGDRLEAIEIMLVEKDDEAPGETDCPFATNNISVSYQTQIQNLGWQGIRSCGALSGTEGQGLRLEGIKINLDTAGYDVGVTYQTQIENVGWQAEVSDGSLSGTEGQSLRLEGIKINLTGDDADLCDIYYQVHAQNVGWMGWAKNGEAAGTEGFGYRLEGIHIVVVPKGQAAPGSTANAFTSSN